MADIAILVCNGSVEDYSYYKKYFEEASLIISVDGGASHLRKFGIKPDIMLGDFDSVSKEDFDFFRDQNVEIFKFPAEKDMTDTELAVETAINRGSKKIIFIGGLGTRHDHSLSNIFILRPLLFKGIEGVVVNEHNEIMLIDKELTLSREMDTKITLLPLSEKVEGVNIKGFYYPLKDATLEMGSTWGVSNEIIEETGRITIKSGLLLVIKSKD
jgi:thiamine pyrophosphokinase